MNVLIVDSNSVFLDVVKKQLSLIDSISNITTFTNYNDLFTHLNCDAVTFDITILNLSFTKKELDFLVSKYHFKNIIALAPNNKDIIRYANYPYIQKIFKTPVDINDLLKYLKISYNLDLSFNLDKSSELELFETFSSFGFNVSHLGTKYLVESILYSQNNDYLNIKSIYAEISKLHCVTANKVEWSIYNSINFACRQKRANALCRYLNIYDGRKPSSKYIIDFFAKTRKMC